MKLYSVKAIVIFLVGIIILSLLFSCTITKKTSSNEWRVISINGNEFTASNGKLTGTWERLPNDSIFIGKKVNVNINGKRFR